MRMYRPLAVLCVFAILAAHALAQDYEVIDPTKLEEDDPDYQALVFKTPPATASVYGTGKVDDANYKISLPFDFIYFGSFFDECYFHINGHIQFTSATVPSGSDANEKPYGFPPDGTGALSHDGMVAALWCDIFPAQTGGNLTAHSEGTAPNRVMVLSWNNVPLDNSKSNYNFQIQLFEATQQIAMVYQPENTGGTTWSSPNYAVGIRAPNSASDERYVTPSEEAISSAPKNNWLYTPDKTPITGRLLFDQVVNDENGIGTSVKEGVPAAGALIEFLLADDKTVVGRTFADADGKFTLNALALPSGKETGSLRVVSGSSAALVRADPEDDPTSLVVVTEIPYGEETDLGDISIGDKLDEGAAFRQAFNVARVCALVRSHVEQTVDAEIPQLDVLFTPKNGQGTKYTPATDTVPASMRIASDDAGNPDGWDDDVIARTYAHHAAEYVTGVRGGAHTPGLDVSSSPANAFIEGFGAALWASLSGRTTAIDATSSSTAVVIDLNDPSTLSSARSASVAGWAAAAIFDLIDGGDEGTEKHDSIDGSGVENRPLLVLEQLEVAPVALPFVAAWKSSGFSLAGITSNFIHHGLLGDDANESNDSFDDAKHLGTIGLVRGSLVLNEANEDWYSFDVAAQEPNVKVDVSFNRFAITAGLTLQVYDAQQNLLATGAPQGTIGPFTALINNVAPGRYTMRIRHDSGAVIPTYQVQAAAPLRFIAGTLKDWTRGFLYTHNLQAAGGIPPYTLSVPAPSSPPTGLILDSVNLRVTGTPATAGRFQFLLSLRDSGTPVNEASAGQDMRINDPLSFGVEEVLGLALDRPSDLQIERLGGTEPISVSTGEDALPAGLTFTTDLRLTGTATEAGGLPLHIEATDVAGSSAEADTTLVICAPYNGKNTAVPLIDGPAAAGYYIDGVIGTTFSLKIKTGKKQTKRALQAELLGPDGRRVQSGVISAKTGSASFKKVVLPETGRYFAIVTSASGPASELVAVLKTKLVKKGKARVEEFGAGDTEVVRFGALQGTVFTIQAKPKDDLVVQPQFLEAPDGSVIPQAQLGAVEGKKGSFTLTRTLDQGGTWVLNITRKSGSTARLDYKLKFKHPKGGEFSAD